MQVGTSGKASTKPVAALIFCFLPMMDGYVGDRQLICRVDSQICCQGKNLMDNKHGS